MNEINFINELCDLVFNYDANPQYIYPYLQKNLNLLNEELIDILRNTVLPRLRTVSLEETQSWAYSLGNLGTILVNFPYGDKPTNVEIAIISLQISASIYEKTKALNPQNWILTQGELAKAYRNRIKGNPEENIEQAINLYLETLKFFDKNSIEWAKGQSNLAVAYIHRIKGNKKENFYLAEECFKHTSKIYLEQGFTDGWAALEYNLGNFYGDLIKLKLEENSDKITELQESRIKSYENALQVWKCLTHGKQWGDAQYNLAQAYNERKIGDPIENQQRSIFHYKQALEFRTIEDFCWDWAVTQKDLGNAYRDMGSHQTDDSQRLKDFLQAIQHYQGSLTIYTESQSLEQRQIIINQIRELQKYCDAQKLPNEKIKTTITTSNEDVTFFTALWYLSGRYGNSFEDIAAFFEENLHKFDETFSQRFENWILTTLCQDSSEENSLWASTPTELKIGLLDIFAMNLLKFTRGDINRNMAIAIKVFEITTELWKKQNNLEHWAGSQSLLGKAYRQSLRIDNDKNKLHKSIKCYENALQVYTITDFPEQWAECQIDLARSFENWLGKEREEKLLKAIKCYQNACQYHTLDNFPEQWARNQIYIALVHQEFLTERSKHLEQAKQFTEQAVQALSKKPEFQENWAKAIVHLGIIFTLRIEGNKATNVDEAIELYEESSKILNQDRSPDEWAINQHNLANAYLFRINGNKSENIEKAIEYCNRALSVHTRQSNPKAWGKVIHTMGKAYFYRLQGDPIENLEKALDCYNQALEVFNQQYDSVKWAEIQVNLSALYLERKSGNLQKNRREAISCCENAFLVYKKDKYPLEWADAHIELAIAQRNLENWEQSVSSFNYALKVYQVDDFPGRYIAINSNLGTTYMKRAHRESDTQSKLSYLKQAINCFEETLKIAIEKGSPEDCIPPQLNLSSAYIEYLELLVVSGDIVKPSDTEKVFESCRKCLDHFQQQGSPEMVVKVYANLGKFYVNIQPDDDLAYENFAQAIDQLENLRTDIISNELSKQQWSAKYDFIYHQMISICLKMGTTRPEYNKKAFEYSERNKARSLVELINSRDRYPDNLSSIELERLKILKQQIIRIQQQLYLDDVYQSNNPVLNRTQLRQQLDTLQKQKNQIIQDKNPNFTLKEQVTNLHFSEIHSLLANSKTCAVSWYFLENTLVTFIITPDLSEPYVLLSDHQSVFREIINWLNSYAEWSEEKDKNQRQIKHEEWMKSLPSRLDNLASSLKLDKIMEKLQQFEKEYNTQYKKLLLIPHWLLHLVPLHVLPLSESNCLIDYFQLGVNYIPCCQLLQKISSYKKQLNFDQFFAIKNPTQDLLFASLEVDMIEKLVKPVAQNIKILHEDYATKANLYQSQELTIANCMHFACHGSFVAQIPIFSGLYLANKELLTLGEILELDLHNCYLITLSACETGQVDYHTVSEYVGLPSAFLYARASSVVSSLWSVDDRATAFLLIKLYQNLLAQPEGQKNVIQALREAQLWLRDVTKNKLFKWIKDSRFNIDIKDWLQTQNKQPFSSPYYWAAFCVIGK